jgi:2-hydroxychromene-2-carboxylate isomerase
VIPGAGRPGQTADAAVGPVVEFYFGLGSRYSYLASTQIAALSAETGAAFEWLPLDSRRLIGARGKDPFAVLEGSGQYD